MSHYPRNGPLSYVAHREMGKLRYGFGAASVQILRLYVRAKQAWKSRAPISNRSLEENPLMCIMTGFIDSGPPIAAGDHGSQRLLQA